MCRNIAALRGLEPPVTAQEVEAAAVQFVRKVTGVTSGPLLNSPVFERAVRSIAAATTQVLTELPARTRPPRNTPASRRRVVVEE